MPAHTLTRFTIIASFFCGATWLWLKLDRSPPAWDDAYYLTNSLRMYDTLVAEGIGGYARQFLSLMGFKAPLIAVLPTPFYLILGRQWTIAYAVNLVAMVFLFAAVWAIGRRFGSERTGLVAVFICATTPLLYGLSRWFLTEYVLAALVACAVWLILVSADFQNQRATLMFGVISGLGLLLKVSYPVFIIVPALTALARAKDRVRVMIMLTLPAALIAGPWYILNWRRTIENVVDAGYGASALTQSTGGVFTPRAVATYLDRIAREGVSVYWLMAAVAAAGAVAYRKDWIVLRRSASVLLWLTPFVIFLFGVNKDIRYVAPLLPFAAVAIAIVLDQATAGRAWLLGAIFVFPFVSFVTVSFAWPYRSNDTSYARSFQTANWRHQEILEAIRPAAGESKRLVIGTDRAAFNADNFSLLIEQERLPLTVQTTAYENNPSSLRNLITSADFFIYKEGGEPESTFYNRQTDDVVRSVRGTPDMVELPNSYRLPDGGVARIFRRRVSALPIPAIPDFSAAFGDSLELLGLQVSQGNEEIEVRCRWRCLRRLDQEYWSYVHVVDDRGTIVAQADYPLDRNWKPEEVKVEERKLSVTGRQGKLRIRLGIYHPPTGKRMMVTREPSLPSTVVEDRTGIWVPVNP